jgi:hypothetical protein
MLGVQRSTVSTVLRGLQTSGLIDQRRGGIEVVERAGLEQAACECYRKIRYRFETLLPGTYAEPEPDQGGLDSSTQSIRRVIPAVKP